jgi:hypothetical protein
MKKGWKVLKDCVLSVPEPDFMIVPRPCAEEEKVQKKTGKDPEKKTSTTPAKHEKRPKG